MNKKLLIVVNELSYFISHRLNVATEAKKKGYEVYICYGENKIKKNNFKIKKYFKFFHVLINRGNINPFTELNSIYSIYCLIKKINPSVLHLVTLKPCLYGGIASFFLNIKAIIFALPGLGTIYNSKKIKFIIIKNLTNFFFKILFRINNCFLLLQNNSDKRYFLKKKIIDKNKVKIIKGSGVNLSNYQFVKERANPIVISFISRLIIEKGIEYFISAAEIIKKRTNLNLRFRVYGSIDPGNPQSITKIELKKWKKDGFVEFFGYSKNINNVLKNTNIVCLPSFYGEGLPRILLEAAAAGRSVVTTNHPGCRDSIIPNVTGYLVPIKNSKQLADKLEFLASKNKIRSRMGKNARIFAEKNFSTNFIAQKHMKLYKKLTKAL